MTSVTTGSLPWDLPFSRTEFLAAGFSESQLRTLLRRGDIRRLVRNVYIDAGIADSLEIRTAGLAKVIPANAVITDLTAYWLHGGEALGSVDPFWLPPIQIFRMDGDDRLRREGLVTGKRTLDPDRDLVTIGVLSVTSRLRTACDLGRLLRRRDAYIAVNSLARLGEFGRPDLTDELVRFRGMRGVVQLRRLVELVEPLVESPAESMVLLQICDADLPRPVAQYVVRNAFGVERYRLDFAYPELKLAIEYDGIGHHSSREERAADERRRAELGRHGWTFVILRKEHVYGTQPCAEAMIRDALFAVSRRVAS